jgi:triosephosphate isomerase
MVQNSRRRPIVAGNWKMNKLVGQSIDLAAEVKRRLSGFDAADIVLCPPFTALKSVGDLIRFSDVKLGAQNLHWEAEGAYTGEVSAAMLQDLACEYVIIGHSERRAYFGETDEGVNRKARAALDAGLKPIICFGETLEQREAGRTEEVVREQVQHGLDPPPKPKRPTPSYAA